MFLFLQKVISTRLRVHIFNAAWCWSAPLCWKTFMEDYTSNVLLSITITIIISTMPFGQVDPYIYIYPDMYWWWWNIWTHRNSMWWIFKTCSCSTSILWGLFRNQPNCSIIKKVIECTCFHRKTSYAANHVQFVDI